MRSRTATVTFYYCDHCNKRYERLHAAEYHEKHCMKNPHRTCKLCGMRWDDDDTLAYIRDEITPEAFLSVSLKIHDCPMCVLGTLIQAGYHPSEVQWDYQAAYVTYYNELEFMHQGGFIP